MSKNLVLRFFSQKSEKICNLLSISPVYPPTLIHLTIIFFQYMKKSFFITLFCALFLQMTTATAAPAQNDPEVKVIVSPRRIWIVTDEMPVKSLTVQVLDTAGKVVMEQKFSSKTADWSLDLQTLPAGRYSVVAGAQEPIRFRK